MNEILNVFTQDAFGVAALTEAINDITPTYGRVGALGLFPDVGVTQRTVAVDFDPITNVLLPQTKWGGAAVANKTGAAYTKAFSVPHFPLLDEILASDLQGRRRPGSNMVEDAQYVLGKKMREARTKLEQTREWLRLGCLKGLVTDGAGATILDLYVDFGLTQDSTSLVLSNSATDVAGKLAIVKRNIEKNLRGELMTDFVALCSDTLYDAFVSHANVKPAFQYYSVNNQNLAGDYRSGFRYANMLFVNYSGSVTDANGTAQKMIADDEGYVVPLGTNVFQTWNAPADYMETVNTEGVPFYMKQRPLEFDKGIQIECQSNPLPICLKPMLIQKITKG